MALRIGGAVLDLDRGTLRRDGEIVPVRPKTLELLAFLTRNPGRVLSKDELLQAVWPGIIVTEDSLTQSIRDARKSIGDEAQALIRTVPRRGYLFQLPETEAAQPPAAAAARAEPTVAVLPFDVDPADATAKALFDGAVEEITNALSYFKTVAVLARHSAFALAEHSREDIRATAERLGADYITEGRVETAGTEYGARGSDRDGIGPARLVAELHFCHGRYLRFPDDGGAADRDGAGRQHRKRGDAARPARARRQCRSLSAFPARQGIAAQLWRRDQPGGSRAFPQGDRARSPIRAGACLFGPRRSDYRRL
ncbi:MAG: hypothetical protein EOS81_16415 [Mesorhizobium sp.]|nr:hypothetical protein EJ072_35140 [Mesorhizobium sp. M2A.F.Ca.ET.046.03.2.1]RUX92750.1 hypothetical protein EOA25_31295 [Mesorhizobium sp. M2A.F.Ca.ET.040.01.1.1]RWA82371.1 MAG: hypothetical protein EOQ31_30125 [Mesorhizobium sp.]RWX70319.1 hypothetical protein EOA24_09145 [Mesorhizobium sp. M2A.F.Ca.ET.039.01.1.1]RWB44443.1 MAG: hypothetical protein EOQ44_14995 [Mesorhizobium sp.]